METNEYFTPEEIAKMFKVKKNTVYIWIRKGKLRAVKLGSLLRVPKSALEEFIEEPGKEKGEEKE